MLWVRIQTVQKWTKKKKIKTMSCFQEQDVVSGGWPEARTEAKERQKKNLYCST